MASATLYLQIPPALSDPKFKDLLPELLDVWLTYPLVWQDRNSTYAKCDIHLAVNEEIEKKVLELIQELHTVACAPKNPASAKSCPENLQKEMQSSKENWKEKPIN